MADQSLIEWTDATWNPVTGCSVVSPGCTNCYAMKLAGTRLQHHPSRQGLTRVTKAGPVWTGEVRLNEDWLDQPLRWRRPRRIFVCAHGDLFAEGVPDAWIDRVFAVMALCPQHTFQVLTKRADRMLAYMRGLQAKAQSQGDDPSIAPRRIDDAAADVTCTHGGALEETAWPLRNVWLGISAEDQMRFEERVPFLRRTPAAVRFISFEPLLSAIHAAGWLRGIDWAIVGGENGPRPMHPEWARQIREDCDVAGVAFFFKQWGSWVTEDQAPPDTVWFEENVQEHDFPDGQVAWRLGKRWAGRLLDGRTHDAMPEVRT
ncbi:MAG: DUF5131 family protein [Phenylobacterium sp.]|uniref:DUF5131 family protein n=1 Tax=Phenylobacterium sp. TaxID=1871053 RepID=UPI0039188760